MCEVVFYGLPSSFIDKSYAFETNSRLRSISNCYKAFNIYYHKNHF